ncbi:sugar phosphate isomerase/epimerase family protein [Devosia sp.]|uniref:sugar phosphate isomerase/epimerase family protein n=1 Tax=Devosia sp. TaxID=1871048 RepID=UPI003F7094FB
MFFGTNVYGWTLLARRDGKDWSVESAMADARAAGISGWEHSFRKAEDVEGVAAAAARQGLAMRSAYVFGAFHEPELAAAASANALEVAAALRQVGVRQLIFNPDPLPGGALKSDAQLRTQSAAIEALGQQLAAAGSRLLYHTHDPEMKGGAREFHHMMVNTDPAAVGLCLDVHWVYRGAENSQVALEDIVSLYAARIGLLHLRQSAGGVWTEDIGAGDIDFAALAAHLVARGVKAHLVLELAMEAGTPAQLSGTEANARSIAYLEPLFSEIAIN